MRVYDPDSGASYFQKRRRSFDDVPTARELTFSCYRKFPLLSRDRTRLWFVEALEAARREWPVDLWAWVVMPDHVHLLVNPREPNVEIGALRGRVKEIVARNAIEWLAANSPEWLPRLTVVEGSRVRRRFWQPGGGYDRSITNVLTLRAVIDYIHANPVRRGLVERCEDYEWSSARWYAGLTPFRIEMDRTLPLQLN